LHCHHTHTCTCMYVYIYIYVCVYAIESFHHHHIIPPKINKINKKKKKNKKNSFASGLGAGFHLPSTVRPILEEQPLYSENTAAGESLYSVCPYPSFWLDGPALILTNHPNQPITQTRHHPVLGPPALQPAAGAHAAGTGRAPHQQLVPGALPLHGRGQ
jgi:hypothetical protein